MSGVEVAREVRGLGCPLYIVGCTGNALREDQVSRLSYVLCKRCLALGCARADALCQDEYMAAGADRIIPKPIHQKAVLEMIREARRRVAGETAQKDVKPDETRDRDPGGDNRL
jgi:CheY-like chemotaxis protein